MPEINTPGAGTGHFAGSAEEKFSGLPKFSGRPGLKLVHTGRRNGHLAATGRFSPAGRRGSWLEFPDISRFCDFSVAD